MIRSRTGLLVLAVFLLALIATFPLRLAVGLAAPTGSLFVARSAEGSVWNGMLRDVSFDTVSVGDFSARLSIWPLFAGKFAIKLQNLSDPAMRGTMLATEGLVTAGAFGVSDLRATIALPGAFDPLPVESLELTDANVLFSGAKCSAASGRAQITLAKTVPGINPGQILSGTLRCDGQTLGLHLSSAADTERLVLRIAADGHYSAKFTVRAQDQALAAGLLASGFRESPAGYVQDLSGHF